MNKFSVLLGSLALSPALLFAQEPESQDQVKFSGWLSVVSAYVSRGGTNSPENDDTVLQGYVNANYKGLYAAYWMSKLGYSFSEIQDKVAIGSNSQLSDEQKQQALADLKTPSSDYYEHDFFVGYSNKYKDWNYDLNVATYYYPGSDHTTGVEAGVSAGRTINPAIGNSFRVGAQTYFNDTVYMNQWDSYFSLDYSHPLPQGFQLDLSTGVSYYQDNGKFEGGTFLNTEKDWVFRHASAQVSHSLFNNDKARGWLKYVVGGENRAGVDQKNMLVAGMRYHF